MISSLLFDEDSILNRHCTVEDAERVRTNNNDGDFVERPPLDNTHIFDDNLEDANYNYENANDSQFSMAAEEV